MWCIKMVKNKILVQKMMRKNDDWKWMDIYKNEEDKMEDRRKELQQDVMEKKKIHRDSKNDQVDWFNNNKDGDMEWKKEYDVGINIENTHMDIDDSIEEEWIR